jgi:hypothetical protein
MNTITTILLVVWIVLVLDSSGSVLCKFNDTCIDFAKRFSILAKFALKDSNWPYVYLGLAVLGLATVLLISKEVPQ